MTRLSCPILVLLLATACGGPVVMIPGGELSGAVEAAPDSWAFSNAHEDVQLETRPADPYSVNVWGVAAGDAFYVAGSNENRWAAHIAADPAVRLRIDGTIYELAATPTDEEAELPHQPAGAITDHGDLFLHRSGTRSRVPSSDAFLAAVKKKYDWEPDEEQRAGATLFRLEPREPR